MTFRVTAILAAYNEEDIVGAVIAHLAAQGVQVYFMDHGSTDATLDEARRFEGRGVIGIEQFPAGETVRWADVLRRKEVLTRELPGDWFVHHDADEFRESPWNGATLLEGIRRVDGLGYNAIDFELLQFRPTHDNFQKGDDPLLAFPFFEPGLEYDRLQIKCWKRSSEVTIAMSGGHDVDFPGRRVFPIRFLLRHYPVRTQTQGTRKVVRERLLRFDPQEHAQGWHLQYAAAREGQSFLRTPADLTRFDAEAVRARICIEHRGVEALRGQLARAQPDGGIRDAELERLRNEWTPREAALNVAREQLGATQHELNVARERLGTTQHELNVAREQLDTKQHEINVAQEERERLKVSLKRMRQEVDQLQSLQSAVGRLEAEAQARQARIEDMLASWSWRSTSAVRTALKRLRGY